jgi:hypothetical protein
VQRSEAEKWELPLTAKSQHISTENGDIGNRQLMCDNNQKGVHSGRNFHPVDRGSVFVVEKDQISHIEYSHQDKQ